MGRDSRQRLKDRQVEKFNDDVADIFGRLQKDQRTFYCGSVDGNAAFSGRRITSQIDTIDAGYNLMTASRGDTLLVSPFHDETLTSPLTMDAIGCRVYGLKVGNQRPQLTVNGTVDLISMEAAGNELRGLHLKIATTDAATAMVNMAASKCKVSDLYIEPSAAAVNVVEVFTVTEDADDCVLGGSEKKDEVVILNKTVAVTSFLEFEGACSNFRMQNCRFFGDVATAGITDSAKVDYLHMEDCYVGVVGTTKPAITLDSNPEGLAIRCFANGTHATLATNANWGNLMRLNEIYTLEETDASVQASNIIPALDTE